MTEEKLSEANELLKELDYQKESSEYFIDTEIYLSDETKIIRFFNSKVNPEIKDKIANVMFKAAVVRQKEILKIAQEKFDEL